MTRIMPLDKTKFVLDTLARAREAFNNENYSDAESLAQQALRDFEGLNEASPQVSVRLLLAEIFIKQRQYDNALPHLHAVLEAVESSDEQTSLRHTLVLLGKVAYYKKNYPLALQHFQQVLTLGGECADEHNYYALYLSGIIHFRQLDNTQSLECSRRALQYAEALNSAQKIAVVCISLGNIYINQGEYVEALKYLRQAESICQKFGISNVEAVVLQNLATLFAAVGDLVQALSLHHRLVEHYEHENNLLLLGYECNNLARAYLALNDFEHAKHFCERTIEILSPLNEQEVRALAHLTLAEVYLKQSQYELAVSICREVVAHYEEIGDKEFISDAYCHLGESLFKAGDIENSIFYLKKAVDLTERVGNFSRHGEFSISLAEVFLAKQRYNDALYYLERAQTLCEQQNMKSFFPKIYLGLSKVFDAKGDLRNAYDYYRKYHESSEAILNLEVEKTAQRLSIQYDLRQKEEEAQREREKSQMLYKINQELQDANRLKNEFLSIAAHDLKNPLQSILGFAQLIQEDHTSLVQAKAHAEVISRSASHMFKMVKSLLESAAIASNALSFEFESVSLNDLLSKIINDFQPTLHAKSQTVSFENLPNAFALIDIDKMREVFSNLISNASKYSPAGTDIVVQIAPSARGGFLVSVRDKGQGLSESDKQHLFGQFQRLSSRPTGGESSTGLGLWIAKAFVEKQGGKIWAESEGKGKGTTFFVDLPAPT